MAEPTLDTLHIERCARAYEAGYSTVSNRRAADIMRELAAERDKLAAMIRKLESAYDVVCAGRSQAAYDQMIADGQADALLELDNARREARATLS
ncbi:hypothetical protein [Leisingera sp.]|uniref:hypothetical protein n=1 Tax=Leisingera sp. TaxID=1879318 RepID=UPI002B264A0A|nr:hypothetical protein [Leisingera sp.]